MGVDLSSVRRVIRGGVKQQRQMIMGVRHILPLVRFVHLVELGVIDLTASTNTDKTPETEKVPCVARGSCRVWARVRRRIRGCVSGGVCSKDKCRGKMKRRSSRESERDVKRRERWMFVEQPKLRTFLLSPFSRKRKILRKNSICGH